MIFSSVAFFVFFVIVIILMMITRLGVFSKNRIRHGILLIASYVFYGWWDWRFCFLMLLLTVVSYGSALQIKKHPLKKTYLIIGVAFPLAVLGVFKYFNFFVDSFTGLFGIKNGNALNIILPVGISFYTFQSLSYTIDVYRKKLGAERDFIKLALYIAFFPQLVAGPIVRASDFLPQLEENRTVTFDNFKTGIQIFVFGLFKKAVIADNLSVFVDDVFRTPKAFHAISLILAVAAYSIQIYFDFSGYSDMAVGCAKCLGYDFARNFNIPYISKNISEFWKRWHISLSSWLKEYLYIPLGGSRKGAARTYLNNIITMLLGGLWHGANWTFIAWGGIHGLALCIHKLYKSRCGKNAAPANLFFNAAKIIVTNVFVWFCWIFFRADSFTTAWQIISRIITWKSGVIQIYAWVIPAVVLVVFASVIAYIKSLKNKAKETDGFYPVLDLSNMWHLVLFFVVIGVILGTAYTGANPFIYFQF